PEGKARSAVKNQKLQQRQKDYQAKVEKALSELPEDLKDDPKLRSWLEGGPYDDGYIKRAIARYMQRRDFELELERIRNNRGTGRGLRDAIKDWEKNNE